MELTSLVKLLTRAATPRARPLLPNRSRHGTRFIVIRPPDESDGRTFNRPKIAGNRLKTTSKR